MRIPRLLGSAALELASLLFSLSCAYNITSLPSPNLDLSQLERVVLTGNFDSISLVTYIGQSENSVLTNGSQTLFTQLPNGAFVPLATSDASIKVMCPFYRQSGELFGVIVGGNFTSLGGVEAQGIALFNTSNNQVVPLPGLNGSVNAMWCDQATDSVYVGGDFRGSTSTNAIAWVGIAGWTNMPFQGFNAPVNAVTKAGNGNIIWGGSFTGLGNMSTPVADDEQIINLSSANLSATGSTDTAGFSNPQNIICKNAAVDSPNSTWLLQDKTPGSFSATFNFGFEPTKIRLWNTHQDGRGTKTWRFSNNPNSILRFTFNDPDNNNQNSTCDQQCPLSGNTTVQFQDFFFVNSIGMNSFTIDISDWYGDGGGLDGIELFENGKHIWFQMVARSSLTELDIFAYAVTDFNEPQCGTNSSGSGSTSTGNWTVTPSGQSVAQYLTADLTGPGINSSSASVTFLPDIKQAGNYTVTIYTPGCRQDNSCAQRGQANITGIFTPTEAAKPVQSTIFQTNDFDKYDQIFTGAVAASSDSFRPRVVLSPTNDQNSSVSLTALRVRFQLLDPSSIGLNGLYEYDPSNVTAQTDFKSSKIDSIGIGLDQGADVRALATLSDSTFVGGNFSSANASNILSIGSTNETVTLPGGGLNGAVATMNFFGNLLFVGGNFSDTNTTSTPGLSNVALFDTGTNTWSALGTGVNGPVTNIVQLLVNVTQGVPEQCITINGQFTQVLATDSHPAFNANGLAIWVPSRNAWLKNLGVQTQAISGTLAFAINMTDSTPLLSGSVWSQGFALSDSAELSAVSGVPSLSESGLIMQPVSGNSLQRRDSSPNVANVTGVVAGLIDSVGGRNLTIFGGHFTAQGSNNGNVSNLAIINHANNQVTGLSSAIDTNSTFTSLSTNGDILYAGGVVTGNANGSPINGLVVWDMATSNFNTTLPPALGGTTVSVNTIATRPSSADLYVAGIFDSAGQVGCPSVCIWSGGQWSAPGKNLAGGNITAMLWQGDSTLLVVGSDITVNNQKTSVATYDANGQTWSIPSGAPSIPGPITALSPASSDNSNYWVAGQDSTNNPFLMLYSNGNFQAAPPLGPKTYTRGLSVLSLSQGQGHASNSLLDGSLTLLVTGDLNLLGFGNCSGVLFDGSNYTAFLLSNEGIQPGSIAQVVTEQSQLFNTGGNQLAVGFVVLIALAIALAIIAALVITGLFIERRRRRAEGYQPAPQNYFEKTANMGRIPPERLFGNLNTPTAPRV